MKEIKTRNNKGITLIALVITIIIVLILATIIIVVQNDGNSIINKAVSSKTENEKAKDKEQVELLAEKYLIDYMGNNENSSLADYLSTKLNGNNIGESYIEMDGRFISVINTNQYTINGKILENGTIKWGILWREAQESGEKIITNGSVNLNVGEYVNYDPEKGAKENSITGYNNQVVYLSRLGKTTGAGWRVLGVDDESGRILLISDTVVGSGNTSYYDTRVLEEGVGQSLVNDIDNVCNLFGQGKYADGARSIKLEDIDKLLDERSYSENIIKNHKKLLFEKNENDSGRRRMVGTTDIGNYWVGTYYTIHGYFQSYDTLYSHGGYSDTVWIDVEFYAERPIGILFNYGLRPVVYLQPNIELKKNSFSGEWDISEIK